MASNEDKESVQDPSDSDYNQDDNNEQQKQNEDETDFEKELRKAFNELDEDQTGQISKEEFGNFIRKLGYRTTMVELQEMIDEMGIGKTIQAISIASIYQEDWPVLIVAPSSLKLNWQEEILEWLSGVV